MVICQWRTEDLEIRPRCRMTGGEKISWPSAPEREARLEYRQNELLVLSVFLLSLIVIPRLSFLHI